MYLKQHMIISKYICHYFSYQVTFGWCAPINARENSNWLSDIKQCKRYKEPDLYCTLAFMMPKELYHKKPVKRPLTMAQPSRILKQLRLLHNFVLYLLCTTKFSLYPWALQESESTYSNNLVF